MCRCWVCVQWAGVTAPSAGANMVPIAAGTGQAAQRGGRLCECRSGCCSRHRSRSHHGKHEEAIWRSGRKVPPRSQRPLWKSGKVNFLNTIKNLNHAWLEFTVPPFLIPDNRAAPGSFRQCWEAGGPQERDHGTETGLPEPGAGITVPADHGK